MLYQSDQKAQEAFLTEISILKFASRDRNVVQFYGVSIRQNGIWLITEHMEVCLPYLPPDNAHICLTGAKKEICASSWSDCVRDSCNMKKHAQTFAACLLLEALMSTASK